MSLVSEAHTYEKTSVGQRNAGIDLIDMLELRKGSRILDLGCGVGNITLELAKKVGPEGKIVAVDPDGERLKIAREQYSASNIEYIQADDQTFPSAQYHVIFANAVIHWIRDKEALFKRVYDNLNPGGQFAFTTPDGFFPIPEIGKNVFDILVHPGFLHQMFNGKMSLLSESEYKSLPSISRFTQITTAVKSVDFQWDDLDSYIESMYGWFQGAFDPKSFDKHVLENLKEQFGDGPIHLPKPHRRLYVILKK